MNKRRIAMIVLVAAAGATAWWLATRPADRHGELVLYGNVDIREVELAFRQPGRLLAMSVDEGATIRRGTTLAELDAQPYRDALAAADAEVQRVQAELDKLRRGNRSQEIRRAEAEVRQSEAALRRQEEDLKRQTELTAAGVATRRNLDALRTERDEAAARLAAARQALSLQQEGSRNEDIKAAEARLAVAQAARAQAQTALDDTRLIAPADGVILARVREPGSMVGNRDTVYTLSLPTPTYVRAYVAEPGLPATAPGTAVRITADGSQRVYRGHVGFVSPRAEFTPKSVETPELRTDLVYRLRIVVPQADAGLRQGMPVTIRVDPRPAGNN
jgi:HlyD family secretion protein